MRESEAVGTFYSFGTLSPARLVSDIPLHEPPRVYVDCHGALALAGALHAVAGVPAKRRRFPAVDSEAAMRRVGPHMAWTGSVFDLLLDNVRFPARRASRSQTLAPLGRFVDDPAYQVDCPCGARSCPVR